MAGFNYAQNIIGLKKGAGDIHELELEVAQLSASVLSIGEDVQEIALEVSQLSASTLPYSATKSTKEAIDNLETQIVLSIPANTYNTYALAFAALETAFNTLSDNDKKKSKIVINDDMVLSIQSLGYKAFTKEYVYSENVYFSTINLSSHKLEEANISDTFVYTDYSTAAQSQKLDLIINS